MKKLLLLLAVPLMANAIKFEIKGTPAQKADQCAIIEQAYMQNIDFCVKTGAEMGIAEYPISKRAAKRVEIYDLCTQAFFHDKTMKFTDIQKPYYKCVAMYY